MAQQKILIATPTRGITPIQWAHSLRSLRSPWGIQVDAAEMHDAPFDHLRNNLVNLALEQKYDWIFFWDDDVLIPPNGLVQLFSRNLDIVSGLYMRRHTPIRTTMMMDVVENGEPAIRAVNEFQAGALLGVDYVGAGCLLIRRNVLEAIKNPWFLWQMHREDLPASERIPEDIFFCKKAKQAGFKIHMDTSVRCLHMGLGKAEIYGTFVPAETSSDAFAFGAGPLTGDLLQSAGIIKKPEAAKIPEKQEVK